MYYDQSVKRLTKETINKIKHLRRKGHSLSEISSQLNIPKTTILRHIKDVKILTKYVEQWLGKRGGSAKRKKIADEHAKIKAKQVIKSLSNKDKMLFLVALYWGEGTKKEFGLSNTDADLIKVFIKGLEEVFNISKNQLSISVRIYEDLDKEKCLKFWSGITGVPENKFINVNVLKGKKFGKLSYGMCRIRVKKGADLHKYIIALRNEVINLF